MRAERRTGGDDKEVWVAVAEGEGEGEGDLWDFVGGGGGVVMGGKGSGAFVWVVMERLARMGRRNVGGSERS